MFKAGEVLVGKKGAPYIHTREGRSVVVVGTIRPGRITVQLLEGPLSGTSFTVAPEHFELQYLQLENE